MNDSDYGSVNAVSTDRLLVQGTDKEQTKDSKSSVTEYRLTKFPDEGDLTSHLPDLLWAAICSEQSCTHMNVFSAQTRHKLKKHFMNF